MLLTEEQTALREVARRFAAERIAPNAAQWDEDGRVPDGFIKEMGDLGFMGMGVGEEWGGSGLDDVSCAMVLKNCRRGPGRLASWSAAMFRSGGRR
jgi:butyryl-CoA dehydrogenase